MKTAKTAPVYLDLSPTWAGIMPALIATIENGTCEGREIARAELARLADSVDSHNAKTRAETAAPEANPTTSAPAPSAGVVSHLKTATAALAGVLAGYAEDNARDADNTAGGPAWRAVLHARAGAFYHAASDAAARGGNNGAELKRLGAEQTDKAKACRVVTSTVIAKLESELAVSRAARATQRRTLDSYAEAARSALAALRKPYYGDLDAARDNAVDAAEILAAAVPDDSAEILARFHPVT